MSVLVTYNNKDLEGTIIVSEGAENPETKANIINAVEAVTGLGKHKIQVYSLAKWF